MGLFTPAWKSKNKEKALKAVRKLTDEATLAKVAKEAEEAAVRKAAVEKLTNQQALCESAKDWNAEVRIAAVRRMNDNRLLTALAIESNDEKLVREATGRLTDFKPLFIMLMQAQDQRAITAFKLVLAVFGEIDDRSLEQIVSNARYEGVRSLALQNIRELALVMKLAGDNMSLISSELVKRINDQQFLKEIALKRDGTVGRAAIGKIGDEQVLKDIVLKASCSSEIRRAALQKISDSEALREIVLHCRDELMAIAFSKIQSDDRLELALESGKINFIEIAIQNISDQNKLRELMDRIPEECNCKAVVMKKITDAAILREIETKYSIGRDGHSWDGCACKNCYETRHTFQKCWCTRCGTAKHDFVYEGPSYHPYNTGAAFRDARCKVCGKAERQSYGWDDSW